MTRFSIVALVSVAVGCASGSTDGELGMGSGAGPGDDADAADDGGAPTTGADDDAESGPWNPDGDADADTDGDDGGATTMAEGEDGADESETGEGMVYSWEELRNLDPMFRQHEDASEMEIDNLGFFSDGFTEVTPGVDNGAHTQGTFRIWCQYSHFAMDDPIVFPGQPGAAHLHMFWGNTASNGNTRFDPAAPDGDPNAIREHGGSTCQAFELNRSSYWMPAMLDRSDGEANIVVPELILLYYKSHRPQETHPLPPGVELIAGNLGPGGVPGATFDWNNQTLWACGDSGTKYNYQSTIPQNCNPGDYIHAGIQFPQCLAVDANGDPVLRSDDHVSHAVIDYDANDPCPASHPYRVPQISYLIFYPNGSDGAGAGVDHWFLSSDTEVPGGSLHGDWLGGWNDDAIQKWIDGCFDPNNAFSGPRNCSGGQTGQNGTGRKFKATNEVAYYNGENFLTDPWPDVSGGHFEH